MQIIEQDQANSLLPLKNLAGALLFTVFLGPVGLLYASSFGGILMTILAFVIGCTKLPLPFLLVWLVSCIWGVVAVNRYNRRIIMSLRSSRAN